MMDYWAYAALLEEAEKANSVEELRAVVLKLIEHVYKVSDFVDDNVKPY